jgi:hypothetical protein
MTTGQPSAFGISQRLRDVDDPGTDIGFHEGIRPQPTPPREPGPGTSPGGIDTVAQRGHGSAANSRRGAEFPGVGANGFAPSDVNLAVGPNHIVQVVNVRYAVFDKSGNIVAGFPKSLGSIWGTVIPGCSGNGGDPVVQYDVLADRWLITQLGSTRAPYSECMAISQSGDPTGAYFLYQFAYGSTLNDYPKFGVWPTAHNSAYLATYNLFFGASGAQLCAYDRAKMLAGDPSASYVCFTISNDFSFLPSDLDGPTPPPDGTPGFFSTFETLSSLRLYKLAPNFSTTPPTGTLTQVSPDLTVAGFTEACNGGVCIPQTGTTQTLDSLGDRPMYRTPFRVFGDHWTMLMSHAAAVAGSAGERWYELRSTGGEFNLFQQGTYAPDAIYRWMGSIAMDQAGDIGLGYSASSSGIHPAIRYTGRVPSDPAGTMEAETSILEGGGSQTGLSRWGDYTAIRIDPADDCTFWYTNQYEAVSGSFNWSTAIASFKFPGCGSPPNPDFSIAASPSSLAAIQGGAAATSTVTVTSLNGLSGTISLTLSGCPSNAACTLTPDAVTLTSNGSAVSTLSITAAANTPTGAYIVTITGTGTTSGPHSTQVAVNVITPTPDFTMTVTPASLTVTRGTSGVATVTVSGIGASSSVTLSASGNPAKTNITFAPNPVTATTAGATSTMTVTADPRGPKGTYTVTIQGTNSGFTHVTQLTLTITP